MNFHILTLFPDMVMSGLNTSILARAIDRGLISIEAVNIRDYTENPHGKVDDYIYGGGAGLLMQAQPVYDAWKDVENRIRCRRWKRSGAENALSPVQPDEEQITGAAESCACSVSACDNNEAGTSQGVLAGYGEPRTRVIYLTPAGRVFHQQMAWEFSREEDLILLCGHYEGIDERVIDEIVTDCVSIGDYVLTGGEIPAMAVVDAVARLVPGVLGNRESAQTDSFQDGLLEYPQYSRPEVWNGRAVPPVLLSGDHARVDAWRREQSIERTKRLRPDLYDQWTASGR